jgi:hypothetical protein
MVDAPPEMVLPDSLLQQSGFSVSQKNSVFRVNIEIGASPRRAGLLLQPPGRVHGDTPFQASRRGKRAPLMSHFSLKPRLVNTGKLLDQYLSKTGTMVNYIMISATIEEMPGGS